VSACVHVCGCARTCCFAYMCVCLRNVYALVSSSFYVHTSFRNRNLRACVNMKANVVLLAFLPTLNKEGRWFQ